MRRKPYPQPSFRKLKGFAFDPSFSSTLSRKFNEVVYKIQWEDNLKPGPCGEYIDVIDYDPTQKVFYEAIDLNKEFVLADHGMTPSEGDPRFHQQQVYAVVMNVINQFEKALGRKIIWSRLKEITKGQDLKQKQPVSRSNKKTSQFVHKFVEHLRIYPHAMLQQNAFYSPDKTALLFGYFKAANSWNGNNIPGSAIFTCLSPDIVAHETTHAILDTIHPFLTNATNDDMLAFHEGFADIIALLQRFTFKQVVEEQIRSSHGDLLSPENLLGDLAIQFGQAVSGNRRALRSYLVKQDEKGNWVTAKPDPMLIHNQTDAHNRGAILVAAVFDAFNRLYRFQVADLIRLASNGSGILSPGEIDPDLASRLACEACEIAGKLMRVCIRALDYCPPADLTFGDYLRALVTADLGHDPDDDSGIRFALMEAFRQWGIVPEDITTFSEESLKWQKPGEYFTDEAQLVAVEEFVKTTFDPSLRKEERSYERNLIESILTENKRKEIFKKSQLLAAFVHNRFSDNEQIKTSKAENLLGMSFEAIEYPKPGDIDDEAKQTVLTAAARSAFQVYKCKPIILPDINTGNTSKYILLTFLQKVYVDLGQSTYSSILNTDKFPFRGGCSLIIDMANYEIKYAIVKSVSSAERLYKQLEYAISRTDEEENSALMMHDDEPFAALHIH